MNREQLKRTIWRDYRRSVRFTRKILRYCNPEVDPTEEGAATIFSTLESFHKNVLKANEKFDSIVDKNAKKHQEGEQEAERASINGKSPLSMMEETKGVAAELRDSFDILLASERRRKMFCDAKDVVRERAHYDSFLLSEFERRGLLHD